jgi:hypothetical protein
MICLCSAYSVLYCQANARFCRRARLRGTGDLDAGAFGRRGQGCHSAMGSQINSAMSMTRPGPAWPGSPGARISPARTQTASFSQL